MGYKILSKKEICPNQYEITIDAPYVVRNAKAGQFIIFRVEEEGERVPLTIADVDKENGLLTIVFMAVGYTTKKLATGEFDVKINESHVLGKEIREMIHSFNVMTNELKNIETFRNDFVTICK